MNLLFAIMIAVSTLLLLFTAPELLLPALTDSSMKAVELSLKMLAIYAVWMGILELCNACGASKLLSRALKPLIRLLYGEIPQTTVEYLSVNMAANVLGMGNAATPAALSAIRSMDTGSTKPSYAMIMLVVLNATSLQLLPASVISLRQSFHSANAADIILPTLISSGIATVLGVLAVKLLYPKKKR